MAIFPVLALLKATLSKQIETWLSATP